MLFVFFLCFVVIIVFFVFFSFVRIIDIGGLLFVFVGVVLFFVKVIVVKLMYCY